MSNAILDEIYITIKPYIIVAGVVIIAALAINSISGYKGDRLFLKEFPEYAPPIEVGTMQKLELLNPAEYTVRTELLKSLKDIRQKYMDFTGTLSLEQKSAYKKNIEKIDKMIVDYEKEQKTISDKNEFRADRNDNINKANEDNTRIYSTRMADYDKMIEDQKYIIKIKYAYFYLKKLFRSI